MTDRYLCPLCDWWLDVPPVEVDELRAATGLRGWGIDQVVRHVSAQRAVTIEGALAGHFATTRHRAMGYGYGPWTADTIRLCACGHPRGDHLRHAQTCLYSTDAETWACDCAEFTAR